MIDIYTDGAGTNHGPVEKRTSGWGIYTNIEGIDYDQYGPSIGEPTNNRGEMIAVLHALKFIVTKGIKHASIVTDSEYVKNGLTAWKYGWIRNGWMTKDGKPVKNKDIWLLLIEADKEAKKNASVKYKWVKGHSGIYGNERADENARLGAELFPERKSDTDFHSVSTEKDRGAEEEQTKKKAKKKAAVTRLLCGSRLVGVTGRDMPYCESLERHVYFMASYDDKDKKKSMSRNCGVPSADCLQGVLLTKEPIPYLPYLHACQNSHFSEGFSVPYVVFWDTVSTASRWQSLLGDTMPKHTLDRLGNVFMEPESESEEKLSVQVTHLLEIPGLAWDCTENLTRLYLLLEQVKLGNASKVVKVPLTNIFLDEKGSATDVCKESYHNVKVDINGKEHTVTLTGGYDMPLFNKLAATNKQEGGVEITLLVHSVTKETASYCVLIESESNMATYNSPYNEKLIL